MNPSLLALCLQSFGNELPPSTSACNGHHLIIRPIKPSIPSSSLHPAPTAPTTVNLSIWLLPTTPLLYSLFRNVEPNRFTTAAAANPFCCCRERVCDVKKISLFFLRVDGSCSLSHLEKWPPIRKLLPGQWLRFSGQFWLDCWNRR